MEGAKRVHDWIREHEQTNGEHFGLTGPESSAHHNCVLCNPYAVGPTESAIIAQQAKNEYDQLTPEAQHQVDVDWSRRSDIQKQDLIDEIELDLL